MGVILTTYKSWDYPASRRWFQFVAFSHLLGDVWPNLTTIFFSKGLVFNHQRLNHMHPGKWTAGTQYHGGFGSHDFRFLGVPAVHFQGCGPFLFVSWWWRKTKAKHHKNLPFPNRTLRYSSPKTNISPERCWLEDCVPFKWIPFLGCHVKFWGRATFKRRQFLVHNFRLKASAS